MKETLTAEQTASFLETLNADRLRELVETLELTVADHRSRKLLIEALVTAPSKTLVEALRLPELREFSAAVGGARTGNKPVLVKRVLHAAPRPAAPRARSATATTNDLKSALQQFSLDGPHITGRNAQIRFVKAFFECFGWRDGEPPGAEIPASLTTYEHGNKTERPVVARWDERQLLVDVVPPDTALDGAWKDLLRACFEQDRRPQFVILSNQREVRLYDLQSSRDEHRLATSIDQLAKYSEVFAPLLGDSWQPGATPKIINVGKVSQEVADLVARLYRSLNAKHSGRSADVIQFTLQCIITMFAEDIGLLPRKHFTLLLYEGAKHRDVERRLRDLFAQMAARELPEPRPVAYFNGGLFTRPVTLPLTDVELTALTKAAEQDWQYVDPHIFGSVFQGIMDDAERHANGAHYTAHEDILRVVGPTIVDPWRKRMADATTLSELLDVRSGLAKFRVLDPACGSGNFLYVAFRELYNLETQLLKRIHEFASGRDVGWTSVISTLNFYGIDINAFAVELAKVTLNIAKKIAFEDRRQKVTNLLEVDRSLPLDNLEKSIRCADALFTEWPEVDAIVGNPPFLAGTSISTEHGAAYHSKLRGAFPAVPGRADLCSYWFRLAHERLPKNGRAGLVATSSIREGNNREAALEYIVNNGGTITNAVSSRPWPGVAAVNVAMVNWIKGSWSGACVLEVGKIDHEVKAISPHLQLHANVVAAVDIKANDDGRSSKGIDVGTKSNQITLAAARAMWRDERSRPFIHPVAQGKQLLGGSLSESPDYIVDMSACVDVGRAQRESEAFKFLKRVKYDEVQKKPASYASWKDRWWQSWCPRAAFLEIARPYSRIIVCSKHAARAVYVFVSTRFFATDSLQMFAFDDDYSFGVLQSTAHWLWTIAKGSKLKADIRYTMEVWNTFPWPQSASEKAVVQVATAARELRATRDRLMSANGWSLRALHQAAEVDGSHPLKNAQRALDEAVEQAYGLPPDQEITEFLLELNECLVEDESRGQTVTGPGLPPRFAPKDPRWSSEDCIQPPSLSE